MIYKIGDFLIRSKKIIILNDNEIYRRVTVRMNHNGVIQRDEVLGSEIKTKRQYLVKSGQFIMSRIDARHGAFGIIPDELDGAIITGDFLAFDIDTDKINLEYFNDLIKSQKFMKFCIDSSTGTTNRKRLKEELFLNFQIEVPSKMKQDKIVKKVKSFKIQYEKLTAELKQKEIFVQRLKISILNDMIQGKLVHQDENDEPARVLMERVKLKREQLIKEKKLKKEKSLPTITDEEKTFEIPDSWEWARLTEIARFIDYRGKTPRKVENGIPLITAKNIKLGFLTEEPREYISEESYDEWMTRGIPNYGDVIFTTEAPLGNVAQLNIDYKFALAQRAIVLSPYSSINKEYLKYALMSNLIRKEIFEQATGTTVLGIKGSKLKEFAIPIPNGNEQKRIVEKVNQLMDLCKEMELAVEQSKIKSEKLMKAVLQEAFTVKEKVFS
ncbi:hypothetical protein COC47_28185 [Bacillus cereus]|uniref:restriction endonuclease subunit S n=1 Tax=Bacillus cereus TaxID=1396 RepID=UPI000BFC778B|nr:restriction endonuclease subunit S [Bacillus cereus]PGR32988.1 hypothetical protein COC47_28185 [Bacillus cereus]